MSVFVHAQGIKAVHAGGREVKIWQNPVHVVVEWPPNEFIRWFHQSRTPNTYTIFFLANICYNSLFNWQTEKNPVFD